MKKTSAILAAIAMVGSVSAASAGGLVVTPSEPEPMPAVLPVSSFGGAGAVVAALAGLAIVAAVASGSDSSPDTEVHSD